MNNPAIRRLLPAPAPALARPTDASALCYPQPTPTRTPSNHPSKRPHKADYHSMGFLSDPTSQHHTMPHTTDTHALAAQAASLPSGPEGRHDNDIKPAGAERSGASERGVCVVVEVECYQRGCRSCWWEVHRTRMGCGRRRRSVLAIARRLVDVERAVERGGGG